jgi:hypothetical protein
LNHAGPRLQSRRHAVEHRLVLQPRDLTTVGAGGAARAQRTGRARRWIGVVNGPGVMTPNEVRQMLNMGPADDPEANRLVTWSNGAAQVQPDAGGATPAEESAPEPSELEGRNSVRSRRPDKRR